MEINVESFFYGVFGSIAFLGTLVILLRGIVLNGIKEFDLNSTKRDQNIESLLNNHITDTTKEISGLSKRMDSIEKSMDSIDSKLDFLVEKNK